MDVSLSTINQGEQREVTEVDEVTLDNMSLPVGSVITSYTSRFESKLTFGDYSKDSDQLQSTWIQSMWAGGLLINDHIEGATDQRGRWAHAWTMTPEQLALPPRHDVLSFGPTLLSTHADARGPISVPLIEINSVLYVAMGKELWKVAADPYSYTNVTTTKVADLPGYAQGPAVIADSNNHFWIPLGKDGVVLIRTHVHAVSPDTVATHITTVKAISFCRWDNKVFAVTLDRYLRISLTTSTWEPESPFMYFSDGGQPRSAEVFYDQSGNTAVYAVTSAGMWAYDHEVGKVYPSSLKWPIHPGNGHGFATWRDDAAFISSGFALTRYTRDGVRTDIGLDRDDGIPPEKVKPLWGDRFGTYSPDVSVARPSRAITSLAGSQNFLVAAVQLGGVTDTGGTCPYAICVWNESGWHVLVEDELPYQSGTGAGRYPTALLVTQNVGGYRVWWGEGAVEHQGGTGSSAFTGKPQLHSIAIPRAFHGPRQRVLDNIESFAPSGYYETGWFDAGMRGFDKTWGHFEVYLRDPGDGLPIGGTVTVKYRTDADPATWNILGTVTNYGRTMLPFNVDGTGMPRGETSRRIELRIELETSNPLRSPIIDSFILKFIKLPLPGRSWQLSVPLDANGWKNVGPREMQSFLARKTYDGGFSVFIDNDRKYRVRISQVAVNSGAGRVPNRHIQVNLIEVPIADDPVWGGNE